jgi:hypothetical protein
MFFFFEDNNNYWYNYYYSFKKITTVKPSRNYWKMYGVTQGIEPTLTESFLRVVIT